MKYINLLVALMLLASCSSQVPIAVNHPISTQLKAKSTHHWDVLADDVAKETSALLDGEPKKNPVLKGKPFYVVPQPGASTFDRAFRDLLITRMVNRGLPVSKQRGTGVEIQYETQIVQHNSPRYGHIPGTLTALAAGVWVVREVVEGSVAAIPGAIGLSALADWGLGKYSGGTTPTELIVTTSIAQDNRYLYRKSSIYYIATEDSELYQESADTPGTERGLKRLEVVGQ